MTGLLADFTITAAVSALAAAVLTWGARRLAPRLHLTTRVRVDRWNRSPVPLLGGVAVWAATLVVGGGVGAIAPHVLPVTVGGTLLLLLGLVDDWLSIKPNSKLSAQLVLACACVVWGLQLNWTNSAVLNSFATVAWIVGVTNAFNLLDNMDGLCAGVSAVAAMAFCAIVGGQDPALFIYAAALSGALAGFLLYNYPPASIFLGDAGSLFLGGTFALLTLSYAPEVRAGLLATIAVPLLIVLLPLFDTVFVTFARKLSARAASIGGRDHPSHRLVALGFSERQTIFMLWLLAALGGAIAWGVSRSHFEAIGLGSLLVVALALLATQLAKVRVYDGDDFTLLRDRAYTPLLLDVTYKRRLFEVVLDTCLISIAYYLAYVLRFADQFRPLYYEQFARSLPIAIGCQIVGLFIAGVYRGVWRYITISDTFTYSVGVLLGWVSTVLAIVYLERFDGYSRSVFMIDALLLLLLLVGTRVAFRWFGELSATRGSAGARAIIYGAGDAGILLARELRNNAAFGFQPVAFADDDPSKANRRIMGLRVVGGIQAVEHAIQQYGCGAVIVSTAKLSEDMLGRLMEVCAQENVSLRRLELRLEDVTTARRDQRTS